MKIIAAHNFYTSTSGENEVFQRETALLEAAGHQLHRFTAHNRDIAGGPAAAAAAIWNVAAARRLHGLVRQTGTQLVHVHGTFAILSPAILRAAHRAGAAVVHTLHNARLSCVNGMLVRDGNPCRRCVGLPLAWPGVVAGCYRASRALSAVVAASTAIHRLAGTWASHVDLYLAPSASARALAIDGGLPADKVMVKPNFTEDRHLGHDLAAPRHGALMVGRIIAEKGVLVAAQAMAGCRTTLSLAGEGDRLDALAELIRVGRVRHLGRLSQDSVAEAMRRAAVLVAPSIAPESFGLMAIEAFSAALPVIAAAHGGLADLVEDGRTGLLVRPGDAADLAAKLRWAEDHPAEMRRMGETAREVYMARFSPQAALPLLEAAYEEARRRRNG